MRIIKLAFISAIVLFVIILLISLLLPSHIRISRAIDISTSRERIAPLLNDASRWEEWNEYVKVYAHRQATPGVLKADDITIQVTSITDSLVLTSWQPPAANKFGSGFAIVTNTNGQGHATVQWYFDFHVKWYPWEKFQSIVYDQQFGPVMEKSLANLKRIAENRE
jgi:Polyketide cyclase / dehydrase and lipid transport